MDLPSPGAAPATTRARRSRDNRSLVNRTIVDHDDTSHHSSPGNDRIRTVADVAAVALATDVTLPVPQCDLIIPLLTIAS
jgi:hypothetical protein